jgi:hypothetical protein
MSNLYMTTEEFADMVVQALHDQNYFKKDSKNHPGDIVIAFTSAAENIASALEWAISREHEVKRDQERKQAVMRTSTLAKNTYYTDTTSASKATYSSNSVLPQDEEIAPALLEDGESLVNNGGIGYSEWVKARGF